jgi:hypothetical protein
MLLNGGLVNRTTRRRYDSVSRYCYQPLSSASILKLGHWKLRTEGRSSIGIQRSVVGEAELGRAGARARHRALVQQSVKWMITERF